MTGLLKDLLGHQVWADAMFFHAWGKSAGREDLELRTRTGHLVDVQEGFLGVLKGETEVPEARPLQDFEGLKRRCQANHEAFGALGRGLDAAALARIVRVPWFPDPPCLVSVAEALVQVCLHSQHHRAQNMARLKALGAGPKNVDYIIWLWKQRPEARWDLRAMREWDRARAGGTMRTEADSLRFMRRAIELSRIHMEAGEGGPFGAVIVKDGEILGEGWNCVTTSHDPTAHAEVVAIRQACTKLGTFQLKGCEIYTSCEPCPMCLAAIYWARLDRIWYANGRADAAAIQFDDEWLYREVALPLEARSLPASQLLRDEALPVFQSWDRKTDKIAY